MPQTRRNTASSANELLEMARSLTRDQVEALLRWSRQLGKLDPSISAHQPKIIALMTHPVELGSGLTISGEEAAKMLQAAAIALEAAKQRVPAKASMRG